MTATELRGWTSVYPDRPCNSEAVTEFYLFGIISRVKPVMLTSRNIGVRGGNKVGSKKSVSKL